MNIRALLATALLSVGVTAAQPLAAATFSFTGSLSRDDELHLFAFEVTADSLVTISTVSYAGGVLGDGTVVPAGGFDPILTVVAVSGPLLGQIVDSNDDGNGVPTDPVTGLDFDALLEVDLAPGLYTLIVSQFDNELTTDSLGIVNGTTRAGKADFTKEFGCSNGVFCDDDGNNRTSAFALDITGGGLDNVLDAGAIVPTPVPLPATAPLVVAALAALGLITRRR